MLMPGDRELLAILGHRIEVWNTAKSSEGMLDERSEWLEQAYVQMIDMIQYSKYEISPVELAELEADLDDVYTFAGSGDDFSNFCNDREQYYIAVRRIYIEQLLSRDEPPDSSDLV